MQASLAFRGLPIDAFPDVSSTQVKIIVKAPGMTPEEVEARVVMPIELEMLGIPKQRSLRAVAKYAIADITLDFEDGANIYWARQQVSERLASAMKDFPAEVSGGLAPITTPLGEMLNVHHRGRSFAGREAQPARLGDPSATAYAAGCGRRQCAGRAGPQLRGDTNLLALKARGLTLADLRRALEANNRNDGAGRLAEGEESLLVRVEGSVKTLDDLRARDPGA